jgi:3-oxoacyl-[acyl-carrier protein] reductase
MGKLAERVAIVTGAASGIGRQIALSFASEGADIIIGDQRAAEGESTARQIRDLGGKAIAVRVDVTKKEEVKTLVDAALDNFKRVDILVNDAGITRNAPLLEMSEKDWDEVLGVNLKGVFLCTQAIAGHMITRQYGKIINIASVAALGSTAPGLANYAASKAGVVQFTKSCALELGPHGINVNAIAPGLIETPLIHLEKTPAEVQQFIEGKKKLSVLDRIGSPQDVANVALFLASDESSFICGQVIATDGGRTDRM